MNSHTFFRLLRWPRPLITLAAALLTVVLGLQGVPFNRLPSATATVPSTNQQSHEPLLSQSNTGPTLLKQGQDYYNAGQYTDAAATWERAEQYFLTQGDTLNRAIALSNRALAYRQLGRINEGVNAAQISVGLLETMQPQTAQGIRIHGQAFNTRGSLHLAQGQTREALQAWEKATEKYQQANYPEGIIKSLLNQAQALRSLGFFRRSSNLITQVQTLLQGQPNSALKVELFRSLGETQRLLGDLNDSTVSFQTAINQAKSLQLSDKVLAKLYLSLGNTQQTRAQNEATLAKRIDPTTDILQINEYQEALKSYQMAMGTASLLTNVRSQLNQLAIFIDLKNWENVQTVARALPVQIDALPPGHASNFARLTLARLLLDIMEQCRDKTTVCKIPTNLQNGSKQIYALLTTVINQEQSGNQSTDPINQSYAFGYLGHLYELEDNTVEAQRLTQQALTLTDQPNALYQWHWQLGRLTEDQLASSYQYYDAAFQEVNKVRDDLSYVSPDARFDFRDRIEPLYREYISLLLPNSKAAETTNTNSVAQLALAQTVIDNLRVAELQNFLACGLLHADNTEPLASIQDIANTDQRTAIIYPIILKDRLEVLVQLPSQSRQSKNTQQSELRIKRYSSHLMPAKQLEEELEDFRKELERPYFSTERGVPKAKELYKWLIAPAEKENWLDSIDTLVFVLDGAFRNVPMAALYDEQTDKFLIEKFAIAVTFGDLEIPKERPDKDFRILAAGLSKDPILPDDIFGPLTYVQNEITQIPAKIDRNPAIFLNGDFRESQVKRTMQSSNYNVVHLATHGEFGLTRDETYLVAAAEGQNDSNKINATKIKLDSFDTLLTTRNRTPLQLLILSACETAKGDDREVLGIAGLAVQTKAHTTLATLWNINDRATSNLMTSFYNELADQDITKAKALQQSQIFLLKAGYRPSVWSPYLMVGDWR